MITDPRSVLILTALAAWRQLLQLGPYVVGGILVSVLLGHLDLLRRPGHWLSRSSPWAVVAATCLGGVSPLCTNGTMPLLVALLRGGALPGPMVAFPFASSLLNPQLFLRVAGGLGLRLALAQAAGVLLLSLSVGVLARRLKREALMNPEMASRCACSFPGRPLRR